MTNLGALGIVALLGTPHEQHDELRDFAGLWTARPALAALMTIFLLSLGGLPPTAGFIGKWYVFSGSTATPTIVGGPIGRRFRLQGPDSSWIESAVGSRQSARGPDHELGPSQPTI